MGIPVAADIYKHPTFIIYHGDLPINLWNKSLYFYSHNENITQETIKLFMPLKNDNK